MPVNFKTLATFARKLPSVTRKSHSSVKRISAGTDDILPKQKMVLTRRPQRRTAVLMGPEEEIQLAKQFNTKKYLTKLDERVKTAQRSTFTADESKHAMQKYLKGAYKRRYEYPKTWVGTQKLKVKKAYHDLVRGDNDKVKEIKELIKERLASRQATESIIADFRRDGLTVTFGYKPVEVAERVTILRNASTAALWETAKLAGPYVASALAGPTLGYFVYDSIKEGVEMVSSAIELTFWDALHEQYKQ